MVKVHQYWVEPNLTGYTPVTNYWGQFSKAEENKETEAKACTAIKELYKELKKEATLNAKKYTEFIMVLNHKCWGHANLGQNQIGQLYSDLYQKAWNFGLRHFKGEELTYMINTLD